jgi:hypothetical protein
MTLDRVLVDTSAWIESFRKAGSPELKEYLTQAIRLGVAATAPIILLELLQGCRTEEERDELRRRLESLDFLMIGDAVWERSYALGFTLRRKGLSVPTADIVIAAVAIENGSSLLHQDKRFELVARHSTLRTKAFA